MKFRFGRFGIDTSRKQPACGCRPSALLAIAKIKSDLPAEPTEQTELTVVGPSEFDRISGIPIWLLEAEGWIPGEDPADYFDLPVEIVSDPDLSTSWYEQLEAEYAALGVDDGKQ